MRLVLGILLLSTTCIAQTFDPRDYGAKCDGVYDPDHATFSGTDDSAALATTLQVMVHGGTMLVPGHCLFTTSLNIVSPYIHFKGTQAGWQHPVATDTPTGLMFGGTGVAINVSAASFEFRDTSLFVKNGTTCGMQFNSGSGDVVIDNAKIANVDSTRPAGAVFPYSAQSALCMPITVSTFDIRHSQFGGFLVAIDDQRAWGVNITDHSEFVINGIGIRLGYQGGVGNIVIDKGTDIETGRCIGCEIVNIDVWNSVTTTIDSSYFEIGEPAGTLPMSGTMLRYQSPNGLRWTSNYVNCSSDPNSQVLAGPDAPETQFGNRLSNCS